MTTEEVLKLYERLTDEQKIIVCDVVEVLLKNQK